MLEDRFNCLKSSITKLWRSWDPVQKKIRFSGRLSLDKASQKIENAKSFYNSSKFLLKRPNNGTKLP